MAAVVPYYIYVELFWPDGTRPTQNQIARVKAADVFNGVTTEQGQSGYDPATGGWMPVYMQAISAFSPPRDQPSLRFQVINTAEQVVHTTQVFGGIPSQSTVRIVIGQSDQVLGGSNWVVSGTVRRQDGTPVTVGTVQAHDITCDIPALVGTSGLSSNGGYSISYTASMFTNNGAPHSQPNLRVRALDSLGATVAEQFVSPAGMNEIVNLTVSASVPSTGRRRVFGNVRNTLGLPVTGITLEAVHVLWTNTGIQEFALNSGATDAGGAYQILYDVPMPQAGLVACSTPSGQVNLLVYAKDPAANPSTLALSSVIVNAPAEQRVDLMVDRTAQAGISEYTRLDQALANCLGANELARWNAMNQVNARPEYLAFIAESTRQNIVLVKAYVTAWLIAGEINLKVPAAALSEPMRPDAIYALLRAGLGGDLQQLLTVEPDRFLNGIIDSIHRGLVPGDLEDELERSQPNVADSLVDDWRIVLAKMLNYDAGTSSTPSPTTPPQGSLLDLVFPAFPRVLSVTPTAFATDTTAHAVAMPATLAGDLLIVLFANDGSATVSITGTTGWTVLWSTANSTQVRLTGAVKIATGSEGGTTVNFQTSTAENAAAHVFRVQQGSWSGVLSDVVVVTAAQATSSGPNSPALTQNWANNKALWLTCAGVDGIPNLTSTPSNYFAGGAGRLPSGSTAGACTVIAAYRQLATNTEDPGAFQLAASEEWVAQTIAIRPGVLAETVVAATYDAGGSLTEAVKTLQAAGTITDKQEKDLRFVFEMYEKVGRYYPIVAAVYPDKAVRQWETIADLATVARDITAAGSGWLQYANASKYYNAGNWPGDVPGRSDAEKGQVYAERLYQLFGASSPQTRFNSDLEAAAATDPTLTPVVTFISQHGDFDIATTNIERYLSDNGIALPANDEAKLKQVQRVYRLAPDFKSAANLMAARMDSAVKIARMDEGRFVATYEKDLGGVVAARKVHQIASSYSLEVLSTLVKFNQNLNTTGGLGAVPGPVDTSAFRFAFPYVADPTALTIGGTPQPNARKYPNWVTLFGDLTKANYQHCQTVLSPAAYLVDLLQFVDGAPKRTLFERRPDLADIELTCANADVALPYIDLVNEVLEAVVSPLEFDLPGTVTENLLTNAIGGVPPTAVQTAFAASGFALTDKARVVASAVDDAPNREWIIQDQAWRFAIRNLNGGTALKGFAFPQTGGESAELEVFPEHTNTGAYAKLATAVFPFNLPLDLGREESEIFLAQRSIRRDEILSGFDVSTFEQQLQAPLNSTTADAYFQKQALAYLRLSTGEARALLGTVPGKSAPNYWGFADTSQVRIPRPDKPTLELAGDWLTLLSKIPVFLHRAGLRYQELLDLLDTQFIHGAESVVQITSGGQDLIDANYTEFRLTNLTATKLPRISFFLRLWRKLGWSMADVDAYLMQLEGGLVPANLARLALVKRVIDKLRLAPRHALALWSPIQRRRTERKPKSVFDEVFLVGSPTQPEYAHLELIARGQSVDSSGLAAGEDLPAYLRGALEVSAEEMEALWARFVSSTQTFTLTSDKLTLIFRTVTLAKALRLSVTALAEWVTLVALDPLPSTVTAANFDTAVRQTHLGLLAIARAQSTRVPVAQLRELLTYAPDPALAAVRARTEAGVVLRLSGAAQAIADKYPSQATPDANALSELLGQVMPTDKIVRVVQILTQSAAPGTAEELALLGQYFSVFISGNATTFLSSLMQLAPDSPRLSAVWAQLYPHLVRKAVSEQALALVSELTTLDVSTADALLGSLLGVAGTGTARGDWETFLQGGWRTDSGTQRTSLVTPRDGSYLLEVTIPAPGLAATTVTLSIHGTLVAGATATAVGTTATRIAFPPQALKAQTVLTLSHTRTEVASVALKIDNADVVALATSSLIPFDAAALLRVQKAAQVVGGWRLTKSELVYLLGGTSGFSLNALPVRSGDAAVAWATFVPFLSALDLNRSVALKDGSLFELWAKLGPSTSAADASMIADQTSWEQDDIVAVRELWAAPLTVPSWSDVALWTALVSGMAVVKRMDLRARVIMTLLVAAEPTTSTAATLRSVYRSRFSRDTWRSAFKVLRDALRQRQRDALVGVLTTQAGVPATPPPPPGYVPPPAFFDANDLFAHYLIDVGMEPDTQISRIRLALNVVQLFVHRVFLGIEDQASLIELSEAKDQWQWMRNYRVWEANRKVFLYPENWIEPELRDDKTEFFRQLEDELQQGELTDARGVAALTSYLEKMGEVSNLEIVGCQRQSGGAPGIEFTLHVVGRTRYRPRGYYYRSFLAKSSTDGTWTPWTKIDLELNADVVLPIIFNGRLHLIWPMYQTRQQPEPLDEGVDDDEVYNQSAKEHASYRIEVQLLSSEYLPSKRKWSKPRVTKNKVLVPLESSLFDAAPGADTPPTERFQYRIEGSNNNFISVQVISASALSERTDVDLATALQEALRSSGGFFSFLFNFFDAAFDLRYRARVQGTFRLWLTGEDTVEPSTEVLAFNDNWPLGTLLQNNAAIETPVESSGKNLPDDVKKDIGDGANELRFNNSRRFFQLTPGIYRLMGTNVSAVGPVTDSPFFYETEEKSLFALHTGRASEPGLTDEVVQVAQFQTFHHPLIQTLQDRLSAYGPAGLMTRETEALPVADDRYYSGYYYNYYGGSLYLGYHIAGDTRAWWTTQRMFAAEHNPSGSTVKAPYPLPTVEFAYGSSFGIYNWELFFHLPMLIADRLSQDLKFEEAMKWLHYVFDPRQELSKYEQTKSWVTKLPPGCRYWNFLPFFANKDTTDSLLDTFGLRSKLTETEQTQLRAVIEDWRQHPFNPHLIARQRPAAYQKFVVMKYLDNLIAWADQLFRQDTFESINQATQLYILAADLLGKKPESIDPIVASPRYTYRELNARGIDAFSNAIVEVENLLVTNRPEPAPATVAATSSAATSLRNLALISFYFSIPRNERMDRYWDTVADRLFKIRNSLNINGVKRRLALYEPPIDPALLVRAAASGIDLSSVVSQLNTPLPLYRFSVWSGKAMSFCNEVKSFGASLLAALEKRDAEQLQQLRQTHEVRMLGLAREVRKRQVEEAEANIEALVRSRTVAEERAAEYARREKVNATEKAQLAMLEAVKILDTVQGSLHALAGVFAIVPDGKTGIIGILPHAGIDVKVGSALRGAATSAADTVGTVATFIRGESTIAGITAGYERRWEDWKFQERQALLEVEQIKQQIVAAEIRLAIAEKELENHDVAKEQAEEIQDYLRDKFTNQELYQWMVSQLSRTYQQVYKLAYDTAKTAQRTFQFELGLPDAEFIQFGYSDSLRAGLLSGEQLVFDLMRMDVAYLERNQREFEVTKPISLAALNGKALQELRDTGTCEFELPEMLYDLDFPGQYFRRVRAVRLSIPCVTGPNTSVSAKLTLLGSAIRKEATLSDPSEYPKKLGYDDPRFVFDMVGIQSIATSTAQNDPGVFELNFRDERYLPFEGAGAISRWRIELPTAVRQFDYGTISDAVMHVSYTARDGGGLLKQGAEAAIRSVLTQVDDAISNVELYRSFSLREEFPDVLHALLSGSPSVGMTILPEHFPFLFRDSNWELAQSTSQLTAYWLPKRGISGSSTLYLQSGSGAEDSVDFTIQTPFTARSVHDDLDKGTDTLLPGWAPETWNLRQTGMDLTNTEDVVLLVKYKVTP